MHQFFFSFPLAGKGGWMEMGFGVGGGGGESLVFRNEYDSFMFPPSNKLVINYFDSTYEKTTHYVYFGNGKSFWSSYLQQ
jgi:hypothetical protein